MGMYTEIVIKSQIKENLSNVNREAIEYLFGNREEEPTELPDHSFFNCSRWDYIGSCSSYYHHPKAINSLVDGYLFSRSDLKNYGNEIDLFFEWFIDEISDEEPNMFVGYSIYEESNKPTLYFKYDFDEEEE